MSSGYHRILFLFVDGVGLAPASTTNPLSQVRMPALERLVGGPLTTESMTARADLLLTSLDATLGVEGLPQSATGQTALLTGVNGAARLGRHQPAYPGRTLRETIARESLFVRLTAMGRSATFANAYSKEYLERLDSGSGRASVTTLAVRAAGLELRRLRDLNEGAAVTWDIERDLFARRGRVKPEPIEAVEAGRQLAALAERHDFTLYETFLTDLAGHGRWGVTADEALRRLDDLVAGILSAAPSGLTWILTSDHGNVEDATTTSHTLHSVPLLVCGPLAPRFRDLDSILEVSPRILALLEADPRNVPT